MVAGLQPRETLLVHGGAGGIGTFAIQLAHQLGSRVLTTAGTPEKRAACLALGAGVAIDYREEDFVEKAREATDGRGVDVVLDNMGAKYLDRNLDALGTEGRLVVIGLQGGSKAELDINKLMRKRAAIIGTTLRSRPVAEKSAICASVVEHVWPLVAEGLVAPVVHGALPVAGGAGAGAPPAGRGGGGRPRADGVRRAQREDPADLLTRDRRIGWAHERGAAA